MRKLSLIIGAAVLVAACAYGGEQITFTVATGTNTTATAYADPFTGYIDEVAVYSTVATGEVSIAALDPYSGDALVLATNATQGSYAVWMPRVDATASTGDTARVVTYTTGDDLFNAQGERIRASITGSRTGVTYRIRIKTK
jgi:hypothetical protein